MSLGLRHARSISTLALLFWGSSLSAQEQSPTQEGEDYLSLAPIGGIPVEVVVNVNFDFREAIEGYELQSCAGAWIHTQEGRLFRRWGWLSHHDRIDGAHGNGRLICWSDWGQPSGTPHWSVQWSSELTLPEPEQPIFSISLPLPPIHLDMDGADVIVIYAPPREFTYWHPGSPDDCQSRDPVPAHQATGNLVFDLDEVEVDRPPNADTSYDLVIRDGMVLLRLPLDRLSAGTSETNTLNLSGTQGDGAWGLRVGLTLTSSPGRP